MTSKLEDLYQQYIDNTCSKEEQEEFLLMVSETSDDTISGLMDHTWEDLNKKELVFPAAESILQNILSEHKKTIVKKVSWYRYVAAIAAILTVIITGIYFYQNKKDNASLQANTTAIQPGKNKATLTLANGKVINLDNASNGQLAQQTGIIVTKTSDGQLVYEVIEQAQKGNKATTEIAYNTITTPRGGQYQVNLPDGSKVWLNAASSLKYPTVFRKDERIIELTGEAYFEVAKAKKVPFIVVTDQQKIEVLGTHFNVNNYANQSETKTTLLEGSVKVSNLKTNRSNLLKPGQQSLIFGDGIKITNVDTVEAVAWKNGYFQFNESNLEDIMKQLSRWYNIDVIFEGKLPGDLFHFKTPRNQSLNEVLKIFELNGINFKIEGRKLIIKS